jgi:hypothetical protein
VEFAQDMYELIYERSRCVYARRLIQKLYERLVKLGAIDEQKLAAMTDAQFEGVCAHTDDSTMRWLYKHYTGAQPLPWTGLLVCTKPHAKSYSRNDKTMRTVVEVDSGTFALLADRVTWKTAERYEKLCAEQIKCDASDLYVLPPHDPRRYLPPKIEIMDGDETYPLADMGPDTPEAISLKERIRVVRIGSTDREALARIAAGGSALMKALWT